LIFSPLWTVVTNIDSDHLNAYQGFKDLVGCFTEHMNRIPFYGSVIACGSDPNLKEALRNVHRPVITYGVDAECDFSARSICPDGLKTRYSLYKGEHPIGEVSLALAGEHNVLNSVAAIIMGLLLGVPFPAINKALENFSGVHRRLEKKGEREGIEIFDDYGHHPSEIAATIKALKWLGRRIVVVFQPHRYSRTQQLMNAFDSCFSEADQLCLMEVYPAGEKPIKGVHSLELANRIRSAGEIHYCPSEKETLSMLKRIAVPGDVILTLGAGDVWKLGETFLKHGC
jgi:UDP-N-acetylmuramate--alanine ligase